MGHLCIKQKAGVKKWVFILEKLQVELEERRTTSYTTTNYANYTHPCKHITYEYMTCASTQVIPNHLPVINWTPPQIVLHCYEQSSPSITVSIQRTAANEFAKYKNPKVKFHNYDHLNSNGCKFFGLFHWGAHLDQSTMSLNGQI